MFPKKAFTLVELMIVIAIIGILAAALFPSISREGYGDNCQYQKNYLYFAELLDR